MNTKDRTRSTSTIPDSTSAPTTQSAPVFATGPLPTVDRLAADFARWASAAHRADKTVTGARLLKVLRLLHGPAYGLTELRTKAEQTAKVAAWSDGEQWAANRRNARAAQKAFDDAWSNILSDADSLFTALTGVAVDSAQAHTVEISYTQLAADARLLAGVNA